MSKKVVVLVTNDFEDSEYTDPVKAMKDAGHEVTTVEMEAGNTIKGKHGTEVKVDKSIDDITVDDFDALFIPGGFSPDQLRGDDRFVEFTKKFADAKKPILAICHGPQLMINAGIVKGKKMTTVKPVVIDLKNAGAEFHDEAVVVDNDLIVTSRTPDDIPDFNREILRVLDK